MGGKRDTVFDIVRTICVLEIVAFWHLTDYAETGSAFLDFKKTSGVVLTASVLAVFTFMSGYFLKKYNIGSIKDACAFYRKRLLRFFPLFFLSSLSLYVASSFVGDPWYPSIGNFIVSLLGFSSFTAFQPSTVWYLSMLMLFYWITPVVLSAKGTGNRFAVAALIYAAISAISFCTEVDWRLMVQMPFYLLGLCLPNQRVEYFKDHLMPGFVCLTVFCILVARPALLPCRAAYVITGLLLLAGLVSACSVLNRSGIIRKASGILAYSSMSMYLFHRHFYLAAVFIACAGTGISLRNATLPLWVLYLIVLPVIIAGSFLIQKIYDRIISKG